MFLRHYSRIKFFFINTLPLIIFNFKLIRSINDNSDRLYDFEKELIGQLNIQWIFQESK